MARLITMDMGPEEALPQARESIEAARRAALDLAVIIDNEGMKDLASDMLGLHGELDAIYSKYTTIHSAVLGRMRG